MKEKSGKIKYKLMAAVFVIAVLVLYGLIYVAPKFSDAFIETYTAEFGTLDVDLNIDYLCVRNERVYTSDADANVVRNIKAGSLVRSKSKIVTVGGVPYTTQERGLVSYVFDGLEKKYTPDNIGDITLKDLTPSGRKYGTQYKLKTCSKGNVKKGTALYKIIDSHVWYLVTFVDSDKAANLVQGARVTVELDDKDHTQLRFTVESVEEPGKNKKNDVPQVKVVLSCDRYYYYEGRLRFGSARVITSQVTGIILETSSISEEDGVKGVYVKNKYADYVFTPIKIIAEVGDKTVCESRTFYDAETDKIISTVKNYDSVKKGDGSENVDQN